MLFLNQPLFIEQITFINRITQLLFIKMTTNVFDAVEQVIMQRLVMLQQIVRVNTYSIWDYEA